MKDFVSSRSCNFLSINTWVKACHVMVVYLFFGLFWVGGVVAEPSIIKSPATIPRHEMPKLSNSSLQIRECGSEKSIFALRPLSDYWIEYIKLFEDCGAKLCGSRVISTKSNVSEPPKDCNQKIGRAHV